MVRKDMEGEQHVKSEIKIGNPRGNFANRNLAETSIYIVLEGDKPRLIDEWQKVPAIWDAVRMKVDENGKKGQFILTGTATPAYKGIMHSEAGRIGTLKMRPVSLWESRESSGSISLESLCHGKMEPFFTGEIDLNILSISS